MASKKEFVEYVVEQLGDGARARAMMGEYVVYCRDKVIGGVYDDRFLVKDLPAAQAVLAPVRREIPYDGAKPMLAVDSVDDRALMMRLAQALYDALPAPRPKKKRDCPD